MPPASGDAMQGPFIGTLSTMTLYGAICMQVFHYASNYAASDRRFIKWWVACIWLLESIHTGFSIHFIEYYLILHFNDPAAQDYIVWTMEVVYLSGFAVELMVDLFFVWRIWQLSEQPFICIFLAILPTARLAIGIVNSTISFQYDALDEFLVKVYPTMIAGWVVSGFADTLIAITLCYYLHKHRSGMKRTDHIINTLLMYTLNTGVLTSFFSILVIITFLALPGKLAFAGFVQVQSKLYAISMLATLNARKQTLENARVAVPTSNNVPLTLIHQTGGKQLSPIEVRKNVEEEIFPSTLLRLSQSSCA